MKCYRFAWSLQRKSFCFLSRMFSTVIKEREIYIPTAYGHIAGKVWGPEDGRKVLALHGWQDNCATFDPLIPLLPKHLQIVAVDFPGHGLSSHKPLGSLYNFIDLLTDVKTVATHLQWKHFSLLGHSMGGAVSLMYASCFPEEIKAVATLDGMDSDLHAIFKYPSGTAYMINRAFKINSKLNNPAPTYSYEAAKSRLLEGQKDFMNGEGISYLMKRAVRPAGGDQNTFVFTRDLRVQALNFQPTSPSIWIEYLENLQCDLLRIKAIDGVKYRRSDVKDFLENHFKGSNKRYQLIDVEGLHHVHLEHPERVAPHLSEFFSIKPSL